MHHPRDFVADSTTTSASSRLAPASVGADWLGDALGQMTGQIRQRLAEVEARHARSLAEMEERIARLSDSAHRARPDLPADLANAFGRLEEGMNDLVKHIVDAKSGAGSDAEKFVFAPRRSEDTSFVTERHTLGVQPGAMPHSVQHAVPGVDGGWDAQSAEALMQLYESGATGVSPAALYAGHADPEVSIPRFSYSAPPVSRTVVAGLGDDRQWVQDRFSAITSDIERTLASVRPDAAIDRLMARVETFETRFETALSSVGEELSTVARTGHIRQLESQIGDMGKQIVTVRQQLERLSAIEAQLQELNAIAAAAQNAEPAPHALVEPAPQFDADAIASNVADLTAQRLASLLESTDAKSQAPAVVHDDATEALLRSYMDERRRSDTATNGMLDTMQEALVRLIDRVEAIDAAQAEYQRTATRSSWDAGHAAIMDRPPAVSDALVAEAAALARANTPAAPKAEVRAPSAPAEKAPPAPRTPRIQVETVVAPTDATPAAKPEQPRGQRASLPNASAATARTAEEIVADLDAGTDDPVVARRAKPAKRSAQPGGLGRRGFLVAMIALLLVGVSYVANLFLANRYGSLMPEAVGTMQPDAARPVAPPPAATSPRQAPAQKSQGAAETPVQPAPNAPSGLNVEPPRAPAVAPDRRSGSEMPRPGTSGSPRSVPETVTDDLSSLQPASPPSLASAAPAPAAVRPALPGIALDSTSGPLRPSEVALLAQRQRLQGAHAPPAAANGLTEFSRAAAPNDGASRVLPAERSPPPAAAIVRPTASAAPAAAIVTGTTNGPQAISLGRLPSAPSTPGVPADADAAAPTTAASMPPATVGPMSLRMAAAQGDPSATFEVGTRYAEGRGLKQDFAEAMAWYQRSAAKGFPLAQYRLGTLYERGLGAPADPARARTWYKRAADQGNVKAMHNIAVLSAGKDAGGPDYIEAARWFTAAAERGLADSQFNLGVLFENGLGVNKDQRQAYKWYALASRGGDKEASRRRDALVASLDNETIRLAEADVATWRSRGVDRRANDARFAGDEWRMRMNAQPTAMSGPGAERQQPPMPPEMPAAPPRNAPVPAAVTPR